MQAHIDHVVFWVDDPERSLRFYGETIGLPAVRAEEFRAGKAPFPSVRLTGAIIDLMPMKMARPLNGLPGAEGSTGHKCNHLCLAMTHEQYAALRARLEAAGIAIPVTMKSSFGAGGIAPEAFYFADPDGNVLEARYYDGGATSA